MQLSVGTVVEGKVSKITNFGAFINIDGGGSGMVHISEVANTYVKDINEHLKVGDSVKAKVVAINENHKIALSIKALLPPEPKPQQNEAGQGEGDAQTKLCQPHQKTKIFHNYHPPPLCVSHYNGFPVMMQAFFSAISRKT